MTEQKIWTAGLTMIALIMAAIILATFSSCNKYEVAWRTATALKSAGTLTDKVIAKASYDKRQQCVKAFGKGTPAYVKCFLESPHYAALKHWQLHAKPTINGALIVFITSMQLAERMRGDYDWTQALKVVACAIAKTVTQFSALFPADKRQQIGSLLGLVQVASCSK